MNDTEALDRLATLMSAEEWDADTLDAISDVVRATGRRIDDVED